MRSIRIFGVISLIVALAVGCGGGGGGGASSSSGVTDAIQLEANLSNVSYLTLSDSASSVTTSTRLPQNILDHFLNAFFPNAYATTFKTNNVYAYDSNGNALENPFKSKVNLFISEAVIDPVGQYAYIGINAHLNAKLFSDFAVIKDQACALYRIKINGGDIKCIIKDSEGGFGGDSIGKNIIFDASSRGYFLGAYNASRFGTSGSEKTRLIRINLDGSYTVMHDVSGWWAGQMTSAKNGNIFFTEHPMGQTGQVTTEKKFILNTTTSSINEISISGYVSDVSSTISGDVYFIASCNLYLLDQASLTASRINTVDNSSCAGSVYSGFSRNISSGTYVNKGGGEIFDLNYSRTVPIANVGSYAVNFKQKNDTSDIPYPALVSSGNYLLAKGSSGGVQQVCSINVKSFVKRCETFAGNGATSILAMMIIKNTAYVYFLAGSSYKQASFDITNNSSSIVVENSTAGDGGLVSAISMRAPITLAVNLGQISGVPTDNKSTLTVSGNVESFTLIEVEFDAPIEMIDTSQVIVRSSNGTVLDTELSIVDKGFTLWIKVKDPTSSNALKYKLFPNGTVLTINLPAVIPLVGEILEGTIGNRTLSLTVSST